MSGAVILVSSVKIILLALLAPGLSGLIKKMKNNMRMRRGESVLQPYYNIAKRFRKDEVVSENTSWIFTVTPYASVAVMLTALFLLPLPWLEGNIPPAGSLIILFFLLTLSRFFMSLAGLDAASAFGGMGSSRDVFIASLAEPAVIIIVFVVGISYGPAAASHDFTLSLLMAAVSLFLVTLAETGRIPVDNQETHLELTMIHEAMLLEYSGKSLALLEFASYLKQALFFSLFACIIPPYNLFLDAGMWQKPLLVMIFLLKMAAACVLTAVTEISFAKMRLFKAADFLSLAFIAALIALIFAVIGW